MGKEPLVQELFVGHAGRDQFGLHERQIDRGVGVGRDRVIVRALSRLHFRNLSGPYKVG